MSKRTATPFDSIENALEYMALLQENIDEAIAEIERDLAEAKASRQDRQDRALSLALFKMQQLSGYVQKSHRNLNDLRTLRRLLLSEREGGESGI